MHASSDNNETANTSQRQHHQEEGMNAEECKENETTVPTHCKLRRKVSVEEAIDIAVPIQRLVEYFFVVSCLPRWEIPNPVAANVADVTAANLERVGPFQTPRTPTAQSRSKVVSITTPKPHWVKRDWRNRWKQNRGFYLIRTLSRNDLKRAPIYN